MNGWSHLRRIFSRLFVSHLLSSSSFSLIPIAKFGLNSNGNSKFGLKSFDWLVDNRERRLKIDDSFTKTATSEMIVGSIIDDKS